MTYKQRFAQQCRDDGFNLPVADALRRLRAGSSDAGWKRLLDRTVAWNQRRQAGEPHHPNCKCKAPEQPKPDEPTGRSA